MVDDTHARAQRQRRHGLLLRTSIIAALGVGTGGCDSDVVVRSSGTTTTSTSGGGGSGAGGAGAVGGGGHAPCEGATPILQADNSESGYVRCPDGSINREAVRDCSTDVANPACTGTEEEISCSSDADCTERPHGVCRHRDAELGGGGSGPPSRCDCIYPCKNDGDCPDSWAGACLCDGVVDDDDGWSHCASADCLTGEDCASSECGVSSFYHNVCGSYEVHLECRAPTDSCRIDADCNTADAQCVSSSSGPWDCAVSQCVPGRPLLIAGTARITRDAARDDWMLPMALCADNLPPALREVLAAHWRRLAAFEHASVASFARFSLQLLALSAPPALVRETHRAAADEIEHARLCYGVASAYAGYPTGPGPLELADMAFPTDKRSVVLALATEACIGETLAVAEVQECAACAADPQLQRLYRRIAADELRHAELAWRALAWLLATADDALRQEVRALFADAAVAVRQDPVGPPVVSEAHGLLSSRTLGELRQRTLDDVILPCLRALEASLPAGRSASSRDAHRVLG